MYLDGKNIKPHNNKQAKELIGKKVQFVRNCDIDKSGRGYFFPRVNVIAAAVGRQIVFEDSDSVYFTEIVEMIELK